MEPKLLTGILFALGIVIGYLMPTIYYQAKSKSVAASVRELYEIANPGSSVEIVAVKDEGNMFKIILKLTDARGSFYREVYVSKDGKFLTEGVIFVKESLERMKKLRDFVDCLYDSGLRIYGILNRTQSPQAALATSLQLNLLGRYSPKLLVSCDGVALQNCMKAGVTSFPSIVYQGKVYAGVKSVEWLSQLTGCQA